MTRKFAIITQSFLRKVLRGLMLFGVIGIVVLIGYTVLEHFNLLEKIDSVEEIRKLILSAGALSYVMFFALQFLQVTFLPIPSMLTTLAGTVIFGPLTSFIYSTCAILTGSLVAFWLGRRYGIKVLGWIAGKEDATKFRDKLSRCKYMFCLMLLFPFSPDDLLCLIAGTTTMTKKFFVTSVCIFRPIAIFFTCFFGGGFVIPFKGYWFILWGALAVAICILFFLSVKYQQKIEETINRLSYKVSLKKLKH
ncbi:MAG: VTT domain-containing protein [Christensenellaceae bacterium]|jgi:uncharacterized membrane protein YdjX (TVP38/TMEM64 family)|nr:VTT domain-containing protein [Christensenellaceae bacterium]